MEDDVEMDRLDKILSNFGSLTRSKAKEYLKKGRITVDGKVEKDGSVKLGSDAEVAIDLNVISREKYRYYMLNKPKGYISSTLNDENDGSPNVISLFKNEDIKGLFPVGRLDKDTTGLLIVTNDGELGHALTSPARHVDKVYLAKVDKILSEKDAEAFREGFEFKDFTSKPAGLEIVSTDENGTSFAKVTVREGKFHQVKRMFLKRNCTVLELKRLQMGSIKLDESLREGEYRKLTEEEVNFLRFCCIKN